MTEEEAVDTGDIPQEMTASNAAWVGAILAASAVIIREVFEVGTGGEYPLFVELTGPGIVMIVLLVSSLTSLSWSLRLTLAKRDQNS